MENELRARKDWLFQDGNRPSATPGTNNGATADLIGVANNEVLKRKAGLAVLSFPSVPNLCFSFCLFSQTCDDDTDVNTRRAEIFGRGSERPGRKEGPQERRETSENPSVLGERKT